MSEDAMTGKKEVGGRTRRDVVDHRNARHLFTLLFICRLMNYYNAHVDRGLDCLVNEGEGPLLHLPLLHLHLPLIVRHISCYYICILELLKVQ